MNAQRIEDLVTAYKILLNEDVLDSFGHVSVRSATDPARFLMPYALPPSLVRADDVIEYTVADSQPVDPAGRKVNGERYIHGEIYKARADVQAVIHSHSPGGHSVQRRRRCLASRHRSGGLSAAGNAELRNPRCARQRARHAGHRHRARRRAREDARQCAGCADARPRQRRGRQFGQAGDGLRRLRRHQRPHAGGSARAQDRRSWS